MKKSLTKTIISLAAIPLFASMANATVYTPPKQVIQEFYTKYQDKKDRNNALIQRFQSYNKTGIPQDTILKVADAIYNNKDLKKVEEEINDDIKLLSEDAELVIYEDGRREIETANERIDLSGQYEIKVKKKEEPKKQKPDKVVENLNEIIRKLQQKKQENNNSKNPKQKPKQKQRKKEKRKKEGIPEKEIKQTKQEYPYLLFNYKGKSYADSKFKTIGGEADFPNFINVSGFSFGAKGWLYDVDKKLKPGESLNSIIGTDFSFKLKDYFSYNRKFELKLLAAGETIENKNIGIKDFIKDFIKSLFLGKDFEGQHKKEQNAKLNLKNTDFNTKNVSSDNKDFIKTESVFGSKKITKETTRKTHLEGKIHEYKQRIGSSKLNITYNVIEKKNQDQIIKEITDSDTGQVTISKPIDITSLNKTTTINSFLDIPFNKKTTISPLYSLIENDLNGNKDRVSIFGSIFQNSSGNSNYLVGALFNNERLGNTQKYFLGFGRNLSEKQDMAIVVNRGNTQDKKDEIGFGFVYFVGKESSDLDKHIAQTKNKMLNNHKEKYQSVLLVPDRFKPGKYLILREDINERPDSNTKLKFQINYEKLDIWTEFIAEFTMNFGENKFLNIKRYNIKKEEQYSLLEVGLEFGHFGVKYRDIDDSGVREKRMNTYYRIPFSLK